MKFIKAIAIHLVNAFSRNVAKCQNPELSQKTRQDLVNAQSISDIEVALKNHERGSGSRHSE
jgi:hypothetical protein